MNKPVAQFNEIFNRVNNLVLEIWDFICIVELYECNWFRIYFDVTLLEPRFTVKKNKKPRCA